MAFLQPGDRHEQTYRLFADRHSPQYGAVIHRDSIGNVVAKRARCRIRILALTFVSQNGQKQQQPDDSLKCGEVLDHQMSLPVIKVISGLNKVRSQVVNFNEQSPAASDKIQHLKSLAKYSCQMARALR